MAHGLQATAEIGTLGVSGDSTLQLTGVQANTGRGVMSPLIESPLVGLSATVGWGRIKQAFLVGQVANAQIGTLVPSVSRALVGFSAAAARGDFISEAGYSAALAGVEATAGIGTLGVEFGFLPLIGVGGGTQLGGLSVASGDIVQLVGTSSQGELGSFDLLSADIPLTGRSASGALGAFSRTTAVALVGLQATAQTGRLIVSDKIITLNWIASPDPVVSQLEGGYFIYWDTAPRGNSSYLLYANSTDAGNVTTYQITGLAPSTTYYVNMSTHGTGGHDQFESGLLGEVSFTTPSSEAEVALVGVQAAGGIGLLGISLVRSLIGLQGTAQRGTLATAGDGAAAIAGLPAPTELGTLAGSIDVGLTGVQATAQIGTLVPAIGIVTQGFQLVGSTGTMGVERDNQMIGLQAGVGTGEITTIDQTNIVLVGHGAQTHLGTLGVSIEKSLSGVGATITRGVLRAEIDGVQVYPVITLTDEDLLKVAEMVWKRILEGSTTAEEFMRLFAAFLANDAAGVGTALEAFKSRDGTKTRVTSATDKRMGTRTIEIKDLDD